MARVKLEGIRKMYQDSVVAVHGVDLDVADGEFVVLVGPSALLPYPTNRTMLLYTSYSADEGWDV